MCAHTCVLMYVYNQGMRVEVRGQPRGQVLAFQSYLFVAQTSFCFVYISICQARRPPLSFQSGLPHFPARVLELYSLLLSQASCRF